MPRSGAGLRRWTGGALAVVGAIVATTWPVTTAGAPSQSAAGAASAMESPDVPEASVGPMALVPPAPAPVSPSAPAPVPARAVADAGESAITPGMTLGVAVLDLNTGELALGRNGSRPFIAASLSKLILVIDMLDRRRGEGRAIPDPDLQLINRALSSSDDGAMNVLWIRYDGPGAVRRVAARLGLPATRAPLDPSQWGNTLVTAGDFVLLYRHILREMAPDDRNVIVDALVAARPTATDGFGQFFGLLTAGASRQAYAKQAWVPYRPAGYLLHSAGVAHDGRTGHDYAIALLSIQPHTSAQLASDRLSGVGAAALSTVGVAG